MRKRESGGDGSIRADERAVSTTLGYSLTLAMTAILVTGLLIAGGALVEDQRERIAEEELSVTSEQLASGLGDADRLAGTVTNGTVRTTVWLPDRIAGAAYTIELENNPTESSQPARATIVAESQAVDVTAALSLRTSIPVANRTVGGGPVVISHRDANGDGDRELVVNESRGLGLGEPALAVIVPNPSAFLDADTAELSSVGLHRTLRYVTLDGSTDTISASDGSSISVEISMGSA